MSLTDIFSGGNKDYSTAEFRRIIETIQTVHNDDTGEDETVKRPSVRIITQGSGKTTVTLAPMKSLSLEEYTFPFQNAGKIADALKLQAMPYTAGGELDIFPVTVSKEGRNSRGIVWYVSPGELNIPSAGRNAKIWPSPLPLVSQLEEFGGNGVTMWADEENICSILWQSNRPVLYRWKKYLPGHGDDPQSRELSWYDTYCQSRGLERGGDFSLNICDDDCDIGQIVSESVRICPWIADVNLSRTVLEGARDLERTVRVLTRISCWLLAVGVIILGAQALSYISTQTQTSELRARTEAFYRETFDPTRTGRISNPVTLARDKIASLSGGNDEAHPLDEVLADLGEVFSAVSGITIDIVRYNADGIDCTGVAPDMTTALNFRKAWEDKANLVQVDNTQFVSGIGYRFDLRVRW
ncbi:MAG: hypothetical protein IJR63_07610 [Synergistaceae bacterium]|nr:hypothetical protein [Synergistaceae bacterium]